jgi:hypothetical protein
MADLFRCDKCSRVLSKMGKKGRLIVQELGEADGMPHPALYNRKLELCAGCFSDFQQLMDRHAHDVPTFGEASDITKSALIGGT